jgi:hypothetical protein
MTKLIGVNIRPGTTPGGMTGRPGGGTYPLRRKQASLYTVSQLLRHRATQFLAARNVATDSLFDRSGKPHLPR